MKRFALFLGFVIFGSFAFVLTSGATTAALNKIVVDASKGHDSGKNIGQRGTTKPFQTLSAGIAAAQSGDTIVVRSGTYKSANSSPVIIDKLLNITAAGATLKAKSADSTILEINAGGSGTTITGLAFNGSRSGTAPGVRACVYVHSSNNVTLNSCKITGAQLIGIGIDDTSDLTTIQNCSFSNNFTDIATPSLTSTVVTRLRIKANTFNGNYSTARGSGAMKLDSQTLTPYYANHIVSRNNIKGPGQEGIEIQGGMCGNEVSINVIDGTGTGISIDGAASTSVTSNTVKGCTVSGIEFVNATNCVATGNAIEGKNDRGGVATQVGYSIANGGYKNLNVNLIIDGGSVVDCAFAPIQIYRQDNVHLRNLYVRSISGNAADFYVQLMQGLSITGCSTDHWSANAPVFYVEGQTEVYPAPQSFHFNNNTINAVAQIGQTFLFYTPKPPVAFGNVVIEDNSVIGSHAGFCPSGFVEVRAPAIASITKLNNSPASARSQSGF
jgi:parallel beta-helix repeat protein